MALHPTRFLKRSSLSAAILLRSLQGQARSPVRNPRHPGRLRTRTRAEMLQAAHIIASDDHLDVLAEAKTAEMSQSMRLRYRSCANSLNRSTLQTERRSTSVSATKFQPPRRNAGADRRHAAGRDNAAIQQYKAEIEPSAPRQPATGPHLAPDQTWDPALWATAMINSLQQPALRPNPPIAQASSRVQPPRITRSNNQIDHLQPARSA